MIFSYLCFIFFYNSNCKIPNFLFVLKFSQFLIIICILETLDYVSLHWQRANYQLWVKCFMSWLLFIWYRGSRCICWLANHWYYSIWLNKTCSEYISYKSGSLSYAYIKSANGIYRVCTFHRRVVFTTSNWLCQSKKTRCQECNEQCVYSPRIYFALFHIWFSWLSNSSSLPIGVANDKNLPTVTLNAQKTMTRSSVNQHIPSISPVNVPHSALK